MKYIGNLIMRSLKSYATYFWILILFELVFCITIIEKVSYTEIDWVAYMQEVKYFLDGELNYYNIRGDTGPLVYPAGFLYVFSIFYYVTNNGLDIRTGQYIFTLIYVGMIITTLLIYKQGEVIPPWACIALVLSKRIHSIFVLRMFNDCMAVLLCSVAILFFSRHKWRFGCLLYSLAVSVKMNILLFAPGVLLCLIMGPGLQETALCLSICAAVQLALGFPFLSTFPYEYLTRSFELNRVFMYKWTVNFKFLPEELFVHKGLSLALLLFTIVGLVVFCRKWMREVWHQINSRRSKATKLLGIQGPVHLIGLVTLSPHYILVTLFTSNFIGVVFARTLHYQFYSWYFFSLPYLLWHTTVLPNVVRVLLLVGIEVSFNVYPATAWSSLLLQTCHAVILAALYFSPVPAAVCWGDSVRGKKKVP